MTPEKLVPSLEACISLKEAGFPMTTHFAWGELYPDAWALVPRDVILVGGDEYTAAPTLAEILAELPPFRYGSPVPHDIYYLTLNPDQSGTTVQYINVEGETPRGLWASHSSAAEAAAMLYLALKKPEVSTKTTHTPSNEAGK